MEQPSKDAEAGYPSPQQQYPPPQAQQVFVQPGNGQPQPETVAQPGAVPTVDAATVIAAVGLPSIALRSLVTGVALLLVGFAYFIVGCISATYGPAQAAEGIIIGLLNMSSGVAGILMKFKLLKIETVDSLINYTWVFICFGTISLATGFGALRFVVYRVALFSGFGFKRVAREHGYAVANLVLGTAAAATTFVFIILIFSVVMLTCSGSIRNRIKAALTTTVHVVIDKPEKSSSRL